MKKLKLLKPSKKRQDVNNRLWYYEEGKHIDLCVDKENVKENVIIHRINASKLLRSLSRIYGLDLVSYVKGNSK